MSEGNGVIRVGRKGKVKFAFGEDGKPFEVDVVVAFQQWIEQDEELRTEERTAPDGTPYKVIPTESMPAYHTAAVDFARTHASNYAGCDEVPEISTAEALDFIARLREQYDELADFFQPKKRKKAESPDTSAPALQFSEEEAASPTSTS